MDDGEHSAAPVFAPEVTALQRAKALRSLVLRLYWDGRDAPSVEVPLGDFFCNPLHWRRFASLPLSHLDDRFVCRFPMPFGEAARGEVENQGSTPVTVTVGHAVASAHGGRRALNYFIHPYVEVAGERFEGEVRTKLRYADLANVEVFGR